ncbi:MAG TPA: F0F1 ATP synthase subunit epsilon [Syntrophales bacterium]|nr:F0F1 ATP synthase subunit epsilon [Syntrophales bacterium]HOL59385.1 F0F1 ATP synthase subunit epsilon [Syntrophales bacterium]HPO35542.1 F0F1 ATP synthase subunit epsilon [Syntrophales bacterium]
MNLKILLPSHILVDQPVTKVIAEAINGSFCLLPRHIDFVAALVPGIFSFTTPEGTEEMFAMDEGILIKCGPEVLVSARNAVRGPDLGSLKKTVEESFLALDEREKIARAAAVKLEIDIVRRFMEMNIRS